MAVVDYCDCLFYDAGRIARNVAAGHEYELVNLSEQVKKRLLNKLSNRVVAFVAAPNPIDISRNSTGRRPYTLQRLDRHKGRRVR